MSCERYAELEAIEDKVWAVMAREAEKGGYLSAEESEAFTGKRNDDEVYRRFGRK